MKRRSFLTSAVLAVSLVALSAAAARAQERDVPKVEVGVQFSSLSVSPPDSFGTENEVGFGGRITYNLTHYFALEAEGNFYPTKGTTTLSTGGRTLQGQFGVKAGKRWERFGLFGKVRPGLVSFGNALEVTSAPISSGGTVTAFPIFTQARKTHFSTDVGGVMEFYASRRLMVRFDFGDTIIRYGERETLGSVIIINGHDEIQRPIIRVPAETKHNFQFTGGIGFRFGGGTGPSEQKSSGGADDLRRFEAGVQFSSLLLTQPNSSFFAQRFIGDDVNAESGFGGWFGVNLNRSVAIEASGNFFPRENFASTETSGGFPSQFQAGVKAGRRWERFGLFAKARPGFVSFSRAVRFEGTETIEFGGESFVLPRFRQARKTFFSADLGGVFEVYPSRRIVTRFDFGDTLIRYGEREAFGFSPVQPVVRLPAETQHNFQFTAGLGFRF